MTIYVSDLGITKNNPYNNYQSKVNYVSINERMNPTPVEKVSKVDSVYDSKGKRSVIQEAEQNFVIGTTPAYTVEFTSAGKVALQTFGIMNRKAEEGTLKPDAFSKSDDIRKLADELKTDNKDDLNQGKTAENDRFSITSEADRVSDKNNRTERFDTLFEDTSVSKTESAIEEESEFDKIRERLLGEIPEDEEFEAEKMAAEEQEKLENSGNPEQEGKYRGLDSTQTAVMKQAVSAYNFQMNFQINSYGIQ